MKECNIILNGERYNGIIDSSAFTICADGGYEMIRGKFMPAVFIGDGDSLLNKDVVASEIIRLKCEKDETDGEAAINYAVSQGYDSLIFYGVDGGRLDHIATNLNMMMYAVSKQVSAVAHCNNYDIYALHDKAVFEVSDVKGRTVSIVPFDDVLHIMDMKGLYYNVKDYDLKRLSSMGMSNVATEESIKVRFGQGRCFVFVLK